jgi:hypothetical protein
MGGEENLTGIWRGLYTYPTQALRVLFDATLIESGRWLSGSTHEVMPEGRNKGQLLCASLLGEWNGGRIFFQKTYENGVPHAKPIAYEGTLSADGTEIEGCWSITGNWSGKFLMIRSTGKEQAVEYEVFERV